jgi:integrase
MGALRDGLLGEPSNVAAALNAISLQAARARELQLGPSHDLAGSGSRAIRAGAVDLHIAWRRIRKLAKLKNARLHDFRHTVGTYGGQAGFNAFLVRDLLGHKTLAMTGRYVENDADPLKRAADAVAGRIAAAMEGKTAQISSASDSSTRSRGSI